MGLHLADEYRSGGNPPPNAEGAISRGGFHARPGSRDSLGAALDLGASVDRPTSRTAWLPHPPSPLGSRRCFGSWGDGPVTTAMRGGFARRLPSVDARQLVRRSSARCAGRLDAGPAAPGAPGSPVTRAGGHARPPCSPREFVARGAGTDCTVGCLRGSPHSAADIVLGLRSRAAHLLAAPRLLGLPAQARQCTGDRTAGRALTAWPRLPVYQPPVHRLRPPALGWVRRRCRHRAARGQGTGSEAGRARVFHAPRRSSGRPNQATACSMSSVPYLCPTSSGRFPALPGPAGSRWQGLTPEDVS